MFLYLKGCDLKIKESYNIYSIINAPKAFTLIFVSLLAIFFRNPISEFLIRADKKILDMKDLYLQSTTEIKKNIYFS